MARISVDIDEAACAEIMRRYKLASNQEAINFALRKVAAEPIALQTPDRTHDPGRSSSQCGGLGGMVILRRNQTGLPL